MILVTLVNGLGSFVHARIGCAAKFQYVNGE